MAEKTQTINKARLEKRIHDLSQIGKISETGVCRLALSKEDKQAVLTVKQWMEEAGLTARIDHFGNLIGRLDGRHPEAPILMIGSHIDSQPYAGRFDGVIGVIGALEAAQTMKELNIVPNMPIEIVAFCDEEGCRFNKGLFGVRGMLGKLEEGELERKDKNGITRRQALEDFGCNPTKFKESEYPAGSISAFLEMHIEQGPILEAKEVPVGIVTGISGPLWLTVDLEGFAGHAGSVPMHMRRDALVGAAKIVVALNELASQDVEAPTVGTVGSMHIFPDSRNIIPEKVQFTIDLRDINIDRRNQMEEKLRKKIHEIAKYHNLAYKISEDTNSEPRYCSERIMQVMRNESSEMGLKPIELMSGPFHDSLAMSYECEYGMIFVRCKDGISHNPKEYSSMEDISFGAELLYRTVIKMAFEKEW
jgi:hydantoinase/carbamoylase family amidase